MKIILSKPLILISILAAILPVARAGSVFEIANTDYRNGKEGKTFTSTFTVEGNNLKMSFAGDSSVEQNETIFRGDAGEMMMVDHKRKTYSVIDRQTIDKLSAKLNEAMAQYEQAMQSVPPGQREMMERMMKGKIPGMGEGQQEPVEVVDTGKTESKGGYDATLYEVTRGGERIREHWVADWSEVEGSEDAMKGFREMSAFFSDMMGAFSQSPMGGAVLSRIENDWVGQMDKLGGFPVLTIMYDSNGKVQSEGVLTSSKKTDVDSSEFEAPKKYKQRRLDKGL